MRAFIQTIDTIVLAIVATVASVISVFGFFNLDWIEPIGYSILTMLLVGSIGIHLSVAHIKREQYQQVSLKLLHDLSVQFESPEIRMFADSGEAEQYLAKRILGAKRSVCDLSWKKTISAGFTAPTRQVTHNYMDNSINEVSGRISYREIFIFSDLSRVERLVRRLTRPQAGYSCRYFRSDSEIPLMQFVVVDEDEVLIYPATPNSKLILIASRSVASSFHSQFESAWASAISIKEGRTIDYAEVTAIRERYPLVKWPASIVRQGGVS